MKKTKTWQELYDEVVDWHNASFPGASKRRLGLKLLEEASECHVATNMAEMVKSGEEAADVTICCLALLSKLTKTVDEISNRPYVTPARTGLAMQGEAILFAASHCYNAIKDGELLAVTKLAAKIINMADHLADYLKQDLGELVMAKLEVLRSRDQVLRDAAAGYSN